MHLDFFRLYTMHDLPGSDLGLPWSNIILTHGASEPAVGHAVAALGCLHRTLNESESGSGVGTNLFTGPFERYQRAIVALRKCIEAAPQAGLADARDVTLVVTLLLFCFEILCGQDELAMKHLEGALSLVRTSGNDIDQASPQSYSTLVLSTRVNGASDVLNQVFLRLASDWLVSGPNYYGGETWPLQAICGESLPAHFQSVREASVHLDALCSQTNKLEEESFIASERRFGLHAPKQGSLNSHVCIDDCWIIAMARIPIEEGDPAFSHKVSKGLSALEQWRASFSYLVQSEPESKPIMLLEVQFLQAWMALRTIQDHDQTICDTFEAEFERAVSVAERYVLEQSTSSCKTARTHGLRCLPNVGNNLASCMCFVVEKCRSSSIRRRAIRILSSLDFRGVFDTPYLVAHYTHIIEQEEFRARLLNDAASLPLGCEDIPTEARFLETSMCWCQCSEEEGEVFYMKDFGRLVYVACNPHTGMLETGSSWFLVDRVNQRQSLPT